MLTTIIKTKNNENTISETLESVKDLGEIIVIDEHSSDDTILISKEYKANIIYSNPMEFDTAFNQAISQAQNDWIMLLEGDEIIPEKLGCNILSYIEKPKKNKNAILLPEKLFYLNKEMKCARKYNLKLFKKGSCELIRSYLTKLKPVKTKTYKINRNFKYDKNCVLKFRKQNICTILQKSLDEAVIRSKENNKNKTSVFIKPLFIFLKLYIFKKAFLEGKKGFIYCFCEAIKEFSFECFCYEKYVL